MKKKIERSDAARKRQLKKYVEFVIAESQGTLQTSKS